METLEAADTTYPARWDGRSHGRRCSPSRRSTAQTRRSNRGRRRNMSSDIACARSLGDVTRVQSTDSQQRPFGVGISQAVVLPPRWRACTARGAGRAAGSCSPTLPAWAREAKVAVMMVAFCLVLPRPVRWSKPQGVSPEPDEQGDDCRASSYVVCRPLPRGHTRRWDVQSCQWGCIHAEGDEGTPVTEVRWRHKGHFPCPRRST